MREWANIPLEEQGDAIKKLLGSDGWDCLRYLTEPLIINLQSLTVRRVLKGQSALEAAAMANALEKFLQHPQAVLADIKQMIDTETAKEEEHSGRGTEQSNTGWGGL